MQLGVAVRSMGPQSDPRTLLACVLAAERAGLADVWVQDHVAIPPDDAEGSGGRYLDPLTALAWLAGRTERIGLGTGVLILPYRPPLPTAKALRYIRLQELGCFLFLVGVVVYARVVLNRWPLPFLIHAYTTGAVLVFLNAVRTLASHRWQSHGEEGTYVDQMLDSVTLDSDSLPAILINPVGLRYHATHHLFPSMPYHQMRQAHKRLLERLPVDSPYRQTVATSIWPVLGQLWRTAADRTSNLAPDRNFRADRDDTVDVFGILRAERDAAERFVTRRQGAAVNRDFTA